MLRIVVFLRTAVLLIFQSMFSQCQTDMLNS